VTHAKELRKEQVAVSIEERGRTRLLVMDKDGTDVRDLDESLDLRVRPRL
jgi:hypothetical protein